ncbi:flagellar export chaperone FliS [Serpentinicella sp. ANB-PHB4]|uniref:flagellar export chaperone FliS n=1 Tax=Serpentinicella sp. ANB-PHB4 TaxID=3074076 RepID=UPI00285D45FA|nr:flagellar export chaperone FliS [Serpentinicella sp. ANB-PHB4]MDR5659796.1 flagellar export chaperone FliS [Serpentinicella sp. ANB-PHB4]
MAMQNPYNQYKENKVKTAGPAELTLMLYDGAIKFINQGKLYIQQKNIIKSNEAIQRAQDIIHELNISLNMDYEMSQNLRALYTFVLDRLVDANIKKDEQALEEALNMVREMRDTWKEAMKLAKTGK